MKNKICGICLKEFPTMWKAKTRNKPQMCKSCALKDSTPIGGFKMTTQTYSIPTISDKQIERLKAYKAARDEYMKKYPSCQAQIPEICTYVATDLHHKGGKVGDMLTNTKYFLALCRACHARIEMAPTWAKENNFSVDRLDK